jgi:pimeloyl-ACP methyl ester carboxylesterase
MAIDHLSHQVYGSETASTTLVLLHGFPLDRRIFDDVAPLLASNQLKVITLDLPGFGQSPFPGDFSMDDLARHVSDFLARSNLLPCVLGGLSMGGYVALQYHRLFPSDLKALILLDTKSAADTPEAKENRVRMADVARREGAKPVARMMYPKMFGESTKQSPRGPELERRLMDIMESCPPATIAAACLAMRDRPDYTPDLAASNVPLLMITGAEDAIAPPEVGQAVANAARQGTFVQIPHAGHIATLEQPAEVAKAITSWLAATVPQ